MKKKVNSIVLVLSLMLITLVGCGNNKKADSSTEPTTEADVITALSTEMGTVTGDFGKATKVSIEAKADSAEYKSIEENLGDVITGFICYEISLADKNDNSVQPEGTVNIAVSLTDALKSAEGNTYEVLYVNGNNISKMKSSVNDNEVIFETKHFSTYAIIKYNSEDKVANATFASIPEDSVGEMAEISTVKHEHNYVDYVYNNDATYDADGTETSTCSTCGTTDTRTKAGTKLEKPAQTNTPAKAEVTPEVQQEPEAEAQPEAEKPNLGTPTRTPGVYLKPEYTKQEAIDAANAIIRQAVQEGRGAEYQGKSVWEIVPEYYNFE